MRGDTLIFFSTKQKNPTNSNLITCFLQMPNTNWNLVPTQASFLLTSALLLVGLTLMPAIFGEDDDDGDSTSSTNLDQEVKQKQKCKIGVFGDPQETVTSTVVGLCNQQAQNNADSDSNLGGIGVSMGP
jgi:hypothetical protein